MHAFLSMLGFWDYVTFACWIVIGAGFIGGFVLVMGLPGKLAIARKHPDAEAVNLMGWLGFAALVPWIQALIWALKPTDVVDIRQGPREEQRAIAESIARMSGTPTKKRVEPDHTRQPPTAASEDHAG
jgi:Protein of unknown function (DUF3302)